MITVSNGHGRFVLDSQGVVERALSRDQTRVEPEETQPENTVGIHPRWHDHNYDWDRVYGEEHMGKKDSPTHRC